MKLLTLEALDHRSVSFKLNNRDHVQLLRRFDPKNTQLDCYEDYTINIPCICHFYRVGSPGLGGCLKCPFASYGPKGYLGCMTLMEDILGPRPNIDFSTEQATWLPEDNAQCRRYLNRIYKLLKTATDMPRKEKPNAP